MPLETEAWITQRERDERGDDTTGKKSGRGAYVCRNPECLRKARKSRALERAFETAIPAEVYDALEAQMS